MSGPLLLFSRHYDRVSAIADGRILLLGQRARCEVMPSIPENFQPTHRSLDEGSVRRLFSHHWDRQRQYFRDTGIFPTMHLLVLRRDVYDEDRQMALDLYAAFADAKMRAVEDLRTNLNALAVTLPMLEEHVEYTRRVFGEDWWPYGIAQNRAAIETFPAYCFEQGLTRAPVQLERVFCPNTLAL
jgi:4,5-dihydroxyphthalate decarboxylase